MSLTTWNKLITPALRYFRRRRARIISGVIKSNNVKSIADIGGSVHYWQENGISVEPKQVSIYNISKGDSGSLDNVRTDYRVELFNGQNVPVSDKHFDLVVSNSVIEHVALDQRQQLVKEMQRIGKQVIIQTPARAFPIDPHFIMPFVHWLPKNIGYLLVLISPWRILSRPPKAIRRSYHYETNILSKRELEALMPGAEIRTERFFGLPKSYVALSRPTI